MMNLASCSAGGATKRKARSETGDPRGWRDGTVGRGSLFPAYAMGEEPIAEASPAAPPPSLNYPGSATAPGASAAALHRRQP